MAVIGAAMLDTMLHVQNCAEAGFEAQLAMAGGANPIFASKSYPAIVKYAAGGVGRNIAECIARCGTRAVLFTTVGQDPSGDALMEYMNEINTGGYGETTTARDEVRLDLSRVKPTSRMPTAAYFSVLKPNGAFVFGANSALITERITSDYILENADVISKASLLIMDTNIPASTIATAIVCMLFVCLLLLFVCFCMCTPYCGLRLCRIWQLLTACPFGSSRRRA